MTVYVMRNGKLVPKAQLPSAGPGPASSYPAPHISRIEPFESPVTGKEISSWRQRDRDMAAAGAVDPRDLDRKPFERRRERNERSRKLAPEWGGLG